MCNLLYVFMETASAAMTRKAISDNLIINIFVDSGSFRISAMRSFIDDQLHQFIVSLVDDLFDILTIWLVMFYCVPVTAVLVNRTRKLTNVVWIMSLIKMFLRLLSQSRKSVLAQNNTAPVKR